MGRINKAYPNLFGTPTEEAGTEDEGGEYEGSTFEKQWGWLANVDEVSETLRVSWDTVLEKPAIEFLNVLSYRRDKAAFEADKIKQWQKTH